MTNRLTDKERGSRCTKGNETQVETMKKGHRAGSNTTLHGIQLSK